MALQRALIPVPFGPGGVDTRTDSKAISPPKLAKLQDGVFVTPRELRKRYGSSFVAWRRWASDEDIQKARTLGVLDNELLLADDRQLYTESDTYWAVRGQPTLSSWMVTGKAVIPDVVIGASDMAASPKLTVLAWESGSLVRYTVLDTVTGATVTARTDHIAGSSRPQCVALGDDVYLFVAVVGTTKIRVTKFTQNGGSYTSAAAYVASDLNGTDPFFDVRAAGTQLLLVYNTSTANTLKHGYVSTALAAGAMNTQATAAAPKVVACAVEVTSLSYGVMWGMDATTTVAARLFDSAAAAITDATDLDATVGTLRAMTGAIRRPVSAANTVLPLELWVVYGASYSPDPSRVLTAILYPNGDTIAGANFVRQSMLVSHAWIQGGDVHVTIANSNISQPTVFGVRVSNGGTRQPWSVPAPVFITANLLSLGTLWGTPGEFQQIPHVGKTATDEYKAVFTYLGSGMGLYAATFTANAALPLVQAGQCVYQPGAMLSKFDGRQVTENGFWLWPTVTTTSVTGGSLTASAIYSYRVFYEWTNGRGERERSTAIPMTLTTDDTNKKGQLTIRPLAHTLKTKLADGEGIDVSIVVYRTIANDVSTYYRVSSFDPATAALAANGYIANDPTSDAIVWLDAEPDASIVFAEADYLSNGELDDVALPPANVIATGNGRVFLSGFDDPNLIQYSKTREFGEPLAFNETLKILLDAGQGPVTAIAMLSDSVVAFRASTTFIIGGDGYDNTGFNTTLTPPRLLSDTIGCIAQESLVNTPMGLIFQSSRGIYLLGSDGSFQYIGADVEAYNTQRVLAAVAMPGTHEIRFTMSGGTTLVYDYAAGQWGTFTVGGLGAVIWKNQYVRLVNANAVTEKEDPAVFTDNDTGTNTPFPMVVRTGWINVAGMQGFQRVRRATVIGDFKSSHTIQVKVYYDYKTTADDTFTWDAGVVVTGTAIYQFIVPLRIQKCEAIAFEFQDISDGPTLAESYRLSELVLEVGVKRGTFREAANRRAT